MQTPAYDCASRGISVGNLTASKWLYCRHNGRSRSDQNAEQKGEFGSESYNGVAASWRSTSRSYVDSIRRTDTSSVNSVRNRLRAPSE